MSTEQSLTGHCLCGAVRITATPKSHHFGACHCGLCRRWGGGPLLAVECEDRVSFEDESHIALYASSDWAERGFCKTCGTHLFYRLKDQPFHAIPIGVFDEVPAWEFAEQIFIDHKPPHYSFANHTKNLTEAEVFAQFSGESD